MLPMDWALAFRFWFPSQCFPKMYERCRCPNQTSLPLWWVRCGEEKARRYCRLSWMNSSFEPNGSGKDSLVVRDLIPGQIVPRVWTMAGILINPMLKGEQY